MIREDRIELNKRFVKVFKMLQDKSTIIKNDRNGRGIGDVAEKILGNGSYGHIIRAYLDNTVYIDADEYYIFDATTKRINSFHGLIDPTVPGSTEFDITYNYDAGGYLTTKSYSYTALPGIRYQMVTYTYTGGNLTHMETDDLFSGNKIKDADLTFNSAISPKNFMYLFPDENTYPEVNQFFNFGTKSTNAVSNLRVNYYTSGALTDSTVSNFSSYILSRDNYVVSVYMIGDDQTTIPASAGKLTFSYHCK